MFLAELCENNIVVGVKSVKSFIDDGRHIIISEEDYGIVLGMQYVDGDFIPMEKTEGELKIERLNELKQQYLQLIRDAKDLGEDEEVARLQQEYQQKKAEVEAQ
jgi:hypothetical protein